ncbi:MAG: SH3 domain-containing protein [Syntrophales bacterium]
MTRRIGLYSVLLAAMLFVGCATAEKKDAVPAGSSKSEEVREAAPTASTGAEDATAKNPKLNAQGTSSPSAPNSVPVPEAQKTEKPAVTYLITTKNGCNVRSQPNEKSKIITTLKRGQKLQKLDKFENWYNVTVPSGKKGWIHQSLVKDAD